VKNSSDNPVLTRSIERACDVLIAFQGEGELLRLREIAKRTGLDDATTLRIVRTLASRGLLERAGHQHYRSRVAVRSGPCYTIGYAAQTTEFAFSREVTASVMWAAETEGVNLVCLDNRYSRSAAIHNAEQLIKRGVDLVIEFQTDEKAAPIIASLYEQAGIPVIAIDIPHPQATFFGADNYKAGLIGGRRLGMAASQQWQVAADEILLLELAKAGPLPASRLTGTLDGLREAWPELEQTRLVRLNGNGQFSRSLEVTRKYLRLTRARRVLVGAINDPSVLGALRAFEEAGRSDCCIAVGQNASLEARAEMRRDCSRLTGSVAYFPETYGPQLIDLALNILKQRRTPPAVFVNHQLVTPQNVNALYPNDPLLTSACLDSLMLQSNAGQA
jgi:ribose transport system substrate-binding protein